MKSAIRLIGVMSLVLLSPFLLRAAAESTPPSRAVDGRLLRYPDVSETRIAFVYAGDIWLVPKTGGTAIRLSSPPGEELYPKFSPDGKTIGFSANYDGNVDIYTLPTEGGVPRRITHHGAPDRMVGWHPDGKRLIFASSRTSERDRFNKLFIVSAAGGLPEQLPVPYGEFGDISPDGHTLAYTTINLDNRTWKRYRGGMNPNIWLFDLQKHTAQNITHSEANNSVPMWHGTTLFFLSDRDASQRNNIWAIDTLTGAVRQITFFKDYDVVFPSIGPKEIVFSQGDRLWLLDLESLQSHPVDIKIITDEATLKPRQANVAGYINSHDISPNGKRIVLAARGDLFTVPKEHGIVRNLTRSSGVAERWPAWSPDGQSIAYFSDRTGEYELTVRPEDGSGQETVLTTLGPGFRYRPRWSPDSKKIAFIDSAMRIWIHDLEKKTATQIDKMLWVYSDELNRFSFAWSPDSRWVAYAGDHDNGQTGIVIYDTKEGARHAATAGFYNDDLPAFDPTGKYLFIRSGRTFKPLYSDLDNTWVYPNTRNLLAIPLRKDVPSPLAPRDDEEGAKSNSKEAGKKDEAKKADADHDAKHDAKTDAVAKADEEEATAGKDSKKEEKAKPVEIDFDGFERRAVVLPIPPGNYTDLATAPGKLIYQSHARAEGGEPGPVEFYDLEKRETKRIVDGVDDYILAANGENLLIHKGSDFYIVEAKENQSLNKKLNTSNLETVIEPMAEWRQIFNDVWRIERDYFYDPGMHQVNWTAMREHYGRLLDHCATRWDVNFVIGELIGELNASHTYRGGGDLEKAPEVKVGYLGCDFILTNGAYQISKIVDGSAWDSEVRSPLLRPGITNVKEGDYLLAVNGVPLDTNRDPWAAFQGLSDQTVQLTINATPSLSGATNVLVHTLESEVRLRNLAWIESNRRRVEEASGGKIGYLYVPSTGQDGQDELVRQFRAQFTKPGLIIDERFNSGGQIPDRFVELLARKTLNYFGVRDGRDWSWPTVAHDGPKAMLINAWSGSGGDSFPYLFKRAGLGPLIGTRTWGGLIGITGAPGLVDNGSITAPTFGIYDLAGRWIIENEGVSPDIEVVDDPAEFAKGRDPQLEKAIEEVMNALAKNPPTRVQKPKYPNRAGNN
jgi:tricorn protease